MAAIMNVCAVNTISQDGDREMWTQKVMSPQEGFQKAVIEARKAKPHEHDYYCVFKGKKGCVLICLTCYKVEIKYLKRRK